MVLHALNIGLSLTLDVILGGRRCVDVLVSEDVVCGEGRGRHCEWYVGLRVEGWKWDCDLDGFEESGGLVV